jgi:ADP-ribosyl-[dinitrogen reductase] hydrolase
MNKEDRIKNMLLMHHAGDSLGATYEFIARKRIRVPAQLEMVGGGPFSWPAGSMTDDSQLTRYLVESYLEDPDQVIELFGEKAVAWMRQGPVDIGNTTIQSLQRFEKGFRPSGVGMDHHQSNGSLMRIAPVAAMFTPDNPSLAEHTLQVGAVTHNHPVCHQACLIYTRLLSLLIEGKDKVDAVYDALSGNSLERTVAPWLELDNENEIPRPHGGYVVFALAQALYLLVHEEDPHQALRRSILLGDDTDTNAAILGALLGASGHKSSWSPLQSGDYYQKAASTLAHMRS